MNLRLQGVADTTQELHVAVERLSGRVDTLGAHVVAVDTRLHEVALDVRKIRDDVYEPVRHPPQP